MTQSRPTRVRCHAHPTSQFPTTRRLLCSFGTSLRRCKGKWMLHLRTHQQCVKSVTGFVFQRCHRPVHVHRRCVSTAQVGADVCCPPRSTVQAFDDLGKIHTIVEQEERQHQQDMRQWNKIVREEKQRQGAC